MFKKVALEPLLTAFYLVGTIWCSAVGAFAVTEAWVIFVFKRV